MFTGLIEATAELKWRHVAGGTGKLCLLPWKPLAGGVRFGDSIAVNGCCLTLEKVHSDGVLEFHVLEETLKRTNLGTLPLGSPVNLERAMQAGARLDGHIVTGHVDGVGRLLELKRQDADVVVRIETPEAIKPFLISKGCIAVDGISLTPVEVDDQSFTVHLIPTTLKETALESRRPGQLINLESDLLAKYVQHQLNLMGLISSAVTMDTLRNAGW